MKGVNDINKDNNVYICHIETFSDELKERIRDKLSCIWHGAVSSSENQDIYNYQKTLEDFLERYKLQTLDTKKE